MVQIDSNDSYDFNGFQLFSILVNLVCEPYLNLQSDWSKIPANLDFKTLLFIRDHIDNLGWYLLYLIVHLESYVLFKDHIYHFPWFQVCYLINIKVFIIVNI